jgi:ABC-type cobalt transport system substrate-binding protein
LAENLAVDAHHAVIVWACYNNQVSGSKVTVSATLGAGAVVGGNIMEIMEYVGQAASPFDSISAIQVKSGTSISCPSLITSQNNEIVIGFGTINGSTYPTDTSGSSVVQVNQPTYDEWAQDIYVPIAGTVVTPTWVDTSALGDFVCTVAFKSA